MGFFLLGAFPLYSPDAYGHLAQGRQIAELGFVPQVDSISFAYDTPQPWSNYEWLYDLVTWKVYDALGPNALIALKCLVLALLGVLLVLLAYRVAGDPWAAPWAAAIALFFAPLARIRFTVRPQIIGLLFPAALLLGIHATVQPGASARRRRAILAAVALMQVFWVNMHGSHLLGLLITGLFAALFVGTESLRWLLGMLALQLGATACTPFGLGIVTDAVSHVFVPEYRALVTEWSPWTPDHPLYLLVGPVLSLLLVLLTVRPAVRRGRFGTAYAVLCVLLSLMAFRSIRFIAHPMLLSAPLIAAGLVQMNPVRAVGTKVYGLVGLAAVWAAIVSPRLEPFVPFGFGEPRLGHAWAVAETINAHVSEPRILTPVVDSWPLMFAVPKGRFLIDGRMPFYGPKFIEKTTNSFGDPMAFQALLDEYEVNVVVADHTRRGQAPSVIYLDRSPAWELHQVQDRQSLFVRQGTADGSTPLRILGPGYRVGLLLEPDVLEAELARETARIGDHQNSQAIAGWIEGLQALRPLARDAGRAGVRQFRTENERESAREAYRMLSRAATMYRGFTSIELYRGLAALAACDVDEAREALGWAAYSGETRETAIASIELVLRTGDPAQRQQAATEIERLRREHRNDPWLEAIAAELEVRCP